MEYNDFTCVAKLCYFYEFTFSALASDACGWFSIHTLKSENYSEFEVNDSKHQNLQLNNLE